MTPDVTSLLGSVIVALFGSGLIVALLTLRPQRAKMRADAASVLTCASAAWVTRVQEQAERAQDRADEAEREAHEARVQMNTMQNRLDMAELSITRLLRLLAAAGIDVPPNFFGPPTMDPPELGPGGSHG